MQKYKLGSINKLLNIASSPINSEIVDTGIMHNSCIYNLLTIRNGFYAFENALHVFSENEFNIVNNIIEVEKLYDITNGLYFAEDIFGNLFCIKYDKIYILDVETGKLDFIASSLNEWAKEILKDYNYFTGYSLAHDWQVANGQLHENQRLVPKKLFIFGGTYSIDNLTVQNSLEALRYRSDIMYQLENVKDGEKVMLANTTAEYNKKG